MKKIFLSGFVLFCAPVLGNPYQPVIGDDLSSQLVMPSVPKWVLSKEVPRPVPLVTTSNDSKKKVDLQYLPISRIVQIYFQNFTDSDYVICDSVLNDNRFVSIRTTSKDRIDTAIFKSILHNSGYDYILQNGVISVCERDRSVSTVDPRTAPILTYKPKYQSSDYLIKNIEPFVDGVFNKTLLQTNNSNSGFENYNNGIDSDLIVFSGDLSAHSRVKKLLSDLDIQSENILVRAAFYEFTKTNKNNSALKVLANFSDKFSLDIGTNGSEFIKIGGSSWSTLLSIISSESDFKLISSPFLRLKNKKVGKINIGDKVPISSEFLTNPNGQITSSNTYVDSGLSLNVFAMIFENKIDLNIEQSLSNFKRNNLSDNDNPILSNRSFNSSATLNSGETIVLGGLSNSSIENSNSGFFGFNFSRSKNSDSSELIVFLNVEKI